MKILALETSAKAVSAAVSENGTLLALGYQNTGLTHSRTLMPIVEHILRNTDLSVQDMDAIAVAVGPGSFTGVRIGVSAAKGLAFGAEKPAIGVSSLAAMARNVSFAGGLIVCAMDARRSQVYNALFASDGTNPVRLTEDRAISLADLATELKGERDPSGAAEHMGPNPASLIKKALTEGGITVVGDGASLCAAFLREAGIPCRLAPAHLVMQSAAGVALEAETLAAAGKLVTAAELRPFYLRPPQALPLAARK